MDGDTGIHRDALDLVIHLGSCSASTTGMCDLLGVSDEKLQFTALKPFNGVPKAYRNRNEDIGIHEVDHTRECRCYGEGVE